MARVDFAFSHRIRVRWAEVDPQRVVFNARYLDYADIAMTEYWRAMHASGLWPYGETMEFHVAKAVVQYRKPIVGDEEIDLLVRTSATGRTSVTNAIEIHGAASDELRAEIELVSVHVDLATHRPAPLPDGYAAAFAALDRQAA